MMHKVGDICRVNEEFTLDDGDLRHSIVEIIRIEPPVFTHSYRRLYAVMVIPSCDKKDIGVELMFYPNELDIFTDQTGA